MIGTLARKRTNLVALAALLALVAAMFVAMAPAAAATYTCKDNSGTLEVHDGTNFVTLATTTGVVTTLTVSNPNGDDCQPIDPDGAFGSAALVAGDQVKVSDGTDTNGDGIKNSFAWEAVYELHLGNAEDEAANAVKLELDNPHNKLKGSGDAARPQSIRVVVGGDGWGDTGESLVRTDAADPVVTIATTALGTDDAAGYWTITPVKSGATTVTVTEVDVSETPNETTTRSYVITVGDGPAPTPPAAADFGIDKVKFSDTDATVSVGTPVTVTVTVDAPTSDSEVRLTVPAGGLLIIVPGADDDDDDDDSAVQRHTVDVKDGKAVFTVDTIGAVPGEYTLTAVADRDGNFVTSRTDQSVVRKKLTVGDAGSAIGSAALSLGARVGANTPLDKTDDKAESGYSGSAGEINLNLVITNSLGKPANNADIQEILVVAPNADVRFANATGATLGDLMQLATNHRIEADDTVSSMLLEIQSTNDAARTIDVHVVVLGRAGSATSNELTLTFTGPLDALSAGEASATVLAFNAGSDDGDAGYNPAKSPNRGADARDEITIEVGAKDAAGNTLLTPNLSAVITDPDGVVVNQANYQVFQIGSLNHKVRVDVDAALTDALDAGEYKITLSKARSRPLRPSRSSGCPPTSRSI